MVEQAAAELPAWGVSPKNISTPPLAGTQASTQRRVRIDAAARPDRSLAHKRARKDKGMRSRYS